MNITRRAFGLGLTAASLAACSGGGTVNRAADYTSNSGFDAWLEALAARARAEGIDNRTLRAALSQASYLPDVVARDRNQAEFTRTLEDYLATAVSDERVKKGRAAHARHRDTLDAIERRFGVRSHIVAAVWGLESFYGARRGDIPVISSTATLAYDGRRGSFFEGQLIAALRILQAGDTNAAGLRGSWAGAMGHTQFMPTSYLAYAVDFTGDGRRDIWGDDPTDALASTAAYLARSGWRTGLPWGAEEGRIAVQGRRIEPQPGGPGFVVTANFDAIKRYNNSDFYAIAVGHLADRIAGAGPLRGSFPPDEFGLTRAERIALQRRLAQLGHDVGNPDGLIGERTRAAISDWQRKNGWPVTGQPSRALLSALG